MYISQARIFSSGTMPNIGRRKRSRDETVTSIRNLSSVREEEAVEVTVGGDAEGQWEDIQQRQWEDLQQTCQLI